jgi:hypothetical protein
MHPAPLKAHVMTAHHKTFPIIASVGASLLGLVIHNTLEFGAVSLLDFASGFIPMLIIEGALLILGWRFPQTRRAVSAILLALALLHLIGGAIVSVLPLTFLPFEPEQSLAHYISHIIYGLLQLPLIGVGVQQIQQNS